MQGPNYQYTGGYTSRDNYLGQSNQQTDISFAKRASPQSSRASSTCSSNNDRYTSQKQSLLKAISENQDETGQTRDVGRPENKTVYEEEQHYQEPRITHLKEPKLIVKSSSKETEAEQQKPLLESPRYLNRGSSDLSSNSLKATSCDSGLPVEDVENQAIDSSAPLIARPYLKIQSKPVARNLTSQPHP